MWNYLLIICEDWAGMNQSPQRNISHTCPPPSLTCEAPICDVEHELVLVAASVFPPAVVHLITDLLLPVYLALSCILSLCFCPGC